MALDLEVAVRARSELGEGPRWVEDRLLWVDITARTLHRFDPATGTDTAFTVDAPIGMVAPRRGGGLLAAMGREVVLFDDDLQQAARFPLPGEPRGNRVNDGRCDPAGRLWIGTMRADGQGAAGALYRVESGGAVQRVESGIGISNGIDWSPGGERMYYIDSPTGRIDVYDFEVADGAARDRRPLIEIPEDRGVPDGMTVDVDGCLWVALHGGWGLRRYTPDGALDRELPLPVAQPTACAFGGDDLGDLYITTSIEGLDEQQLAEQPLAGSLLRVRPGVRGLPTAAFAG